MGKIKKERNEWGDDDTQDKNKIDGKQERVQLEVAIEGECRDMMGRTMPALVASSKAIEATNTRPHKQ